MSTTYIGKIPSFNETRVTRATTREHVIYVYVPLIKVKLSNLIFNKFYNNPIIVRGVSENI